MKNKDIILVYILLFAGGFVMFTLIVDMILNCISYLTK